MLLSASCLMMSSRYCPFGSRLRAERGLSVKVFSLGHKLLVRPRHQLDRTDQTGQRAIVNDDIAEVGIAILLILVTNVDVAGKSLLELVPFLDASVAATNRLKSSVSSSRVKNGVTQKINSKPVPTISPAHSSRLEPGEALRS